MKILQRSLVQQVKKDDKKTIRAWVMYDWANSVYQLTVASIVFPIYFNSVTRTGDSDIISFFGLEKPNTTFYAWAVSAAYLLVALFSPLFSSMADFTGRRKGFMRMFTYVGALGVAMLLFFNHNHIELGLIAFILGTIGYGGSLVFYNSFLPVIASPQNQDKISARGYAVGYLGSIILVLLNLWMILKPEFWGIAHDKTLAPRISFVTVGIWWIAFSQITFKVLPKYTFRKRQKGASILTNGYKELRKVFTQVRQSRKLTIYLFGFFFVMMGLLTTMFMAANYGVKELNLDDKVLIPTILIIQLVGMFGAWFFARLSGKIGNLRAFISSIVVWIFVVVYAYTIKGATGFMIAAFMIGLVMGGSQTLARSTYSKMLPETTDHTSFFSFFDVMEKLATVAGTFTFGIIESLTGSMRLSVLAIAIFFVIGLCFMLLLLRKGKATDVAVSA